jgi:hypothetical protein
VHPCNARLRSTHDRHQSLLIGALLVAVLVLGYLFWERQRNTVEIRLPSVTIEKR